MMIGKYFFNAIYPAVQLKKNLNNDTGSHSYEILGRIINNKGEKESISKYINTLERINLLHEYTLLLLTRTCFLFSQKLGFIPRISINVESTSLEIPSFVKKLINIKNEFNLKDGFLTVEVTENSRIRSRAKWDSLNKLKENGILTSIDDFGILNSDWGELLFFQYDEVKLDKTFLKAKNKDSRFYLFEDVIYFCKENNISIIAEGIENITDEAFARSCGVNIGQGYFYHKPQSIFELF